MGSRTAIRLAAQPEQFSETAVNPVAVGVGSVWVARSEGGLARIDLETGAVLSRIPVGNSPSGIDTGFGAVWVVDDVDNELLRIDPRSAGAVTAATPVGQSPVAITAGEGAVWVANAGDDTVSRIDPGDERRNDHDRGLGTSDRHRGGRRGGLGGKQRGGHGFADQPGDQ